jgi:pimeloyl-ACP methyl ester carboxylesterase
MISALAQGAEKPGPHVVISHSMGTVIAYDCLKRVADCPRVDALMTIGSPLGLDEVQDKLQPGWSREDGFPSATLKDRWVNVFDRLDVVAAFDPEISNDYRKGGDRVIDDLNEQNWGTWRHNISNYLAGAELRGKLQQMLEL